MNKKLIKKILGRKGTIIARSIKKSLTFKKLLINKNQILFTVDCSSNFSFWKNLQNGSWEPKTFEILNKFLDKNHSYIEIGAWIGPTVLYGSQLAKHCYAIEPDPIAFKELKKNIGLNKELSSYVTLSNLCISDSDGLTKLFAPGETLHDGGRSNSTILDIGLKNYWLIESLTFSNFIKSLSIDDCNFIKMDIEGAEFKVLPSMLNYLKNNKPTIFIEFHPMFTTNYLEDIKTINPIFECYDHIFNIDLEQIDVKDILKIDPTKTFHLVLTNDN